MEPEKKLCDQGKGSQPACAPLAVPFVPMQQSAEPAYSAGKALVRGTLFPGLDLPFMGMVNKTQDVTPLTEMMALCFVAHELALYLDTHAQDDEAAQLFNQYVEMYQQAIEQYQQGNGPLTLMDAAAGGTYDCLSGPWPWEYRKER